MGARAQGESRAPVRPKRRRRLHAALLIAAAALLLAAPAARADFHLMSIREVYPGSANDSYVMLQMYSPSQTNLNGHQIVVYGPTGSAITTFTFSGGVSNGQNQRTVLVADDGYAAGFPSGPTPDRTHAALNIPAGGGAVCFVSVDCVSWGNFTGSVFPTPGSPASGAPTGMALHRSIAPGCSTLLEAGDDTNNSSVDFSAQTPNPRANATAIVETECVAPNTTITSATIPAGSKTNSTDISFMFSATPSSGATFECKLDTATFALCTSPQAYSSLDGDNTVAGTAHAFQVRARNASGADPSPATHNWTVDTVPPTMTITNQPADPSSGASAPFTYQANESVTNTQCRLDTPAGAGAFVACPSGSRTYTSLANGLHTFMVRATDPAGNQSTPAAFPSGTYTWTVDNSLADTTPPQTTIVSGPPDPSESSTASFAYESNEPGPTFECALDGAAFVSCPVAGIAYTGLANGPHSFQVRAVDSSANKDPTPAGYSWQVAVPVPPLDPPPVFLSAASGAPQTTITGKPGATTRDRTPTFRFRSSVAGSSFQCKVDRGAFRSCRSPFTTKPLSFGRHAVQVRAVAGGSADPTPARSGFKVAKPESKRRR